MFLLDLDTLSTRTEKLAINKKLLIQILEKENRTHDAAVKELEGKISNLEQQLKPLPPMENTPSQTTSEPSQEIPEDIDHGVGSGVLPQPEQGEVEVSQEGSKKRKRNLF